MATESDVERLLSAAARLNRWVNRRADLELPAGQLRTLALIGDLAPVRVGDLAAADGTSQPTTTSAVGRLETSGLAARMPDPADARATLVELTPAGRRALSRARAQRTSTLEDALTRLPDARTRDVRTAAAALTRLLDSLDGP